MAGFPVLVVNEANVQSVDPATDHVTFKPSAAAQSGTMLLDTPAIGRLRGGSGPPDLVVGSSEEYGCNPATVPGAGLQEVPGLPPCAMSVANPVDFGLGAAAAALLTPANSEVYALSATGAVRAGWPAEVFDLDAGVLPDVGDGTTGSPVLADLAGNGHLEVGAMTAAGPAYIFKPNGTSYLGNGPDGQPRTLSMTSAGPLANSDDLPSIPAVGMPAFAPLGAGAPGISLIAPAASLGKALDIVLPDRQLATDNQIDAWNTRTGQMQAAFPQVVNDLQFFNQPIVANVGSGGPYVVEGSANADVRALNAAGVEAPGFPKFTGDWMVNSPSFGPLGGLAGQVLVAGTRAGDLFVWSTPTARCAPSGPWPKQHHDLANTNNLEAPMATSCPGK
jgi:hypothetical protein